MIIGLIGYAGSGKSFAASHIARRGYTEIILAEPMKQFLHQYLGFSRDHLWGPSALRTEIHPRWGRSARDILQTMGTEWGREMVHPDLWLEVAKLRGIPRKALLSDVRFPNEADWVLRQGGVLWRLLRRPPEMNLDDWRAHASEAHVDSLPSTATIDNRTTTKAECAQRIDELLDALPEDQT